MKKLKSKAAAAFTLVELTVAAGLMTIITIMLYTIFSSAGNMLSSADARIAIYQTVRAIVDTMQRDLQGAVVDESGNVFIGWNRAYTYSSTWVPRVPFFNILCDTSRTSVPYCYPDMLWFRTTTESSNFGTPVEVVYCVTGRHVLEKGVSRRLLTGPTTAADLAAVLVHDPTPANPSPRFDFSALGFNVREFQLRYYQVDGFNQNSDQRVWLSGERETHWFDFWPPTRGMAYNLVNRSGAGANTSWAFDSDQAARARIPAAVQVTLRIADPNEYEWTDFYSTEITDGRDEPRPRAQFLAPGRTDDYPGDGLKQADFRVDEVGIVFRQVIFIPSYIKALGPRRGDL